VSEGLWALVTGASSGIGAAFARALRARGERTLLVARRADRLTELVRELGGEEWASAWPVDLAAEGAAAALRDAIAARGLGVDLLVNNAGLGHTAPFVEQRPEVIRAMLDVNVRAVVDLTHAFLPAMLARGRGRIVNVASTAAFQPVPFLSVYAASKAFVLSFTEGLAEEVRGRSVQVQALCPGPTRTEFFQVAETPPGLLAARLPRLTPEGVARVSLRGLESGRVRVVTGWSNRLIAVLEPFVPSAATRRVAAALYRPRPGGGGAAGS
jgi:uncharacterized protein